VISVKTGMAGGRCGGLRMVPWWARVSSDFLGAGSLE
jgi:hypothetical protein